MKSHVVCWLNRHEKEKRKKFLFEMQKTFNITAANLGKNSGKKTRARQIIHEKWVLKNIEPTVIKIEKRKRGRPLGSRNKKQIMYTKSE